MITELTGSPQEQDIPGQIDNLLKQAFLPEFLNRIDERIIFDSLDHDALRRIVDLQMARLQEQLSDSGYTLEVTNKARELLAEEGYDPQYGARPLKRIIQQRLQNGLANRILAGEFPEGAHLLVDGQADGFTFSAGTAQADRPVSLAGNE